jgi:hypothetical protein
MNTYHPIGLTGLPLPGPVPRTPQLLPAQSCTGGQEIPIDVLRDILDKGDTDAVRRWFDAAPARDINETFTLTARFPSQWITDERVAVSGHTLLSIATNSSVYLEGHVELVRWLLARGADPNTLVEGVREAGSYKRFFARSRREVLTLRAQALKGRAKTSDALLGFVFGLPDGVAWNVLSFWRCHYPVKLPDGEGGWNTILIDC